MEHFGGPGTDMIVRILLVLLGRCDYGLGFCSPLSLFGSCMKEVGPGFRYPLVKTQSFQKSLIKEHSNMI